MGHVITCCCFIDSLVKGAEEVNVVMPTDVHSIAEPVQPVEQLVEEPTNQPDIDDHNSKCCALMLIIAHHTITMLSLNCVCVLVCQ